MQRDEALAAFNEIEQRFFLLGNDFVGVGVDDQSIVTGQGLWIERIDLVGVGHFDAAFFQHGLQLLESVRRTVVAIIAKEQQLNGFGIVGTNGNRREECQ